MTAMAGRLRAGRSCSNCLLPIDLRLEAPSPCIGSERVG